MNVLKRPADPHLAQTGGGRRLGQEAETPQVRLEVSAELHLHWLHPLVYWVQRSSCRPVGKKPSLTVRNGLFVCVYASLQLSC